MPFAVPTFLYIYYFIFSYYMSLEQLFFAVPIFCLTFYFLCAILFVCEVFMSKSKPVFDKCRSWSVITYLPEHILVRRLQSLFAHGNLLHYAYILHDKDTNADGSLKPLHIHLCLYFRNPCRLAYATDWLLDFHNGSGNAFGEPLADRYKMVYDYFIHLSEPNKFQYSFDCVVSDNIEFWSNSSVPAEDTAVAIVEKMLLGVPYIDLVREYGRNFVYHYRAFKSLVEDIQFQSYSDEKKI